MTPTQEHGVKILSVGFIDEANTVEITYMEMREQTETAGILRTLAFSVEEYQAQKDDILGEITEALDEVLGDIRRAGN
jgi:hypothetical protein